MNNMTEKENSKRNKFLDIAYKWLTYSMIFIAGMVAGIVLGIYLTGLD